MCINTVNIKQALTIIVFGSGKAQDLRDQLIMWQTPPEPTWPARQQHLNWLDIAMADVKEIFAGLRRHWYILEQQGRIREAMDLMQVCAAAVVAQQFDCMQSLLLQQWPNTTS